MCSSDLTGTFGDQAWNQVAQPSELNRDGAIRKAEEIMAMVAKGNPDEPVRYTVVPDWRSTYKIGRVDTGKDAEGRPMDTTTPTKAPANILIQIEGHSGTNTFYIPNTKEAMQEPTRYMVNKKWVEHNFKDHPEYESIVATMPDEDGYKGQVISYFKNIAGNRAKVMPLQDAVKEAYQSSHVFREQIKQSKEK